MSEEAIKFINIPDRYCRECGDVYTEGETTCPDCECRLTIHPEEIEAFCAALKIDKEKDIFIFDPSALYVSDVRALGFKNVVRIRRPYWGLGNIKDYFLKITYEELKDLLIVEDEGGEPNDQG